MDTTHLRALLAALDTGSLSGAAARLGVPLSTLSRQVADLEREVGARLLERTGRGVRATPAGERFVARARASVAALELGLAEAREVDDGGRDAVRLSVAPDVSRVLMPGVLVDLARAFPDASVAVHAEVRRVSLLEERYDAAIRVGPLEPSELVASAIGKVSVCVCGPPQLRDTDLEALARNRWVRVTQVPTQVHGLLGTTPVSLTQSGNLTCATFSEAAEVAVALGCAVLLPSFVAAGFVRSGQLTRLLQDVSVPHVQMQVVRVPGRRGSAVVGALVERLRARLLEAEAALAR
jgi:DNA-binding transcriptional LysR family regulator